MFKTINSLRALFFAAFLLFIANSYLLNSNAIILKELGFNDFQIGIVATCIYFGAFVSTILSPLIVQKVGHIRSFGFFSAIFAIAILLHINAKQLYIFCLLRFCLGYCYYALLVVIESWINNRAKNENRSRILAVYEIVFYSGFCLGALFLYFKLNQANVFVLAAIIMLFCSIPLNLLKIKQPKIHIKEKIKIPDVFAISKLAFIAALIGGFLMNGFYSMSQSYFLALGYGIKDISIFVFSAMLGGFIAQLYVGKLSDIYGRKLALLTCSTLAFVASLALLFFAKTFLIYFLCFCLGMGLFCIYVLALARASDRVNESAAILEVGRTLLFTYSVSAIFAPIIMGALISKFGPNSFIILYIILLGILSLFTLTQPKIEAEKRVEFENTFKVLSE
ncbi:MFS transporter [Campylobacter canadensis]|uniref:MFS transporter n=1 Tax=Campylobacter canadensis TaxID=449520 RepID=UPI001554FE24|nr:MFS transporter [Campylobacter canadensis]MBZ7994508.1 MFS transporter [Campylobacter canadensis]MBZ7997195.1 MFS transporter [Campylobacter canadensis]MBZ7999777.1 MFS transporter [Campylobacter canadensis]MBZ8002539.1 MFS transporter [Campylobacter canadensis]MBZ8002911.1 MFS transporter [Campylobacter canadensis]